MSTDAAQPVEIRPRAAATAPLTRTQSLIWTSQRLHPDVPLANMGKRFRITGPIDVDRFLVSFDTVVRACDVLRAVVVDHQHGPVPAGAHVHDLPPATTQVIDLPVDRLDQWCAQRISVPIDATSCMYDSVLLRHADDDWTWWLDLHHVATDAWSSALIFEATAAAYEHEGPPSEADLDTVIDGAFFRYAADPPKPRSRETTVERAAAWEADAEAAGPQPPLTPYGERGPRTTAVRRVSLPLSPDQLDRLDEVLAAEYRTLSRELGLLAIAATATAIAVHRLDGRSSLVLGVPVHHRSSRDAARLVGPLMELYPLPVSIEDDDTHHTLFTRVLRSIMTLLRRAQPGESPDTPFEIVLNVLTARYGDFAGMPTVTEWMRSGHVDPNHALRSQVFDYSGTAGHDVSGLQWELDLNDSLSSDSAAQRFPDHFAAVVAAVLDGPDEPIGHRPIVGDVERAELDLLTPDPAPRDLGETVHERIQRRLRNDPDWIVAEHRGSTLSAAELDQRAERLARWLVEAGLDPGRAVGLRMPRGLDVLIAIQGVLRAGGVFVMLDPDDPPARHDAIAADADLLLVLDRLPDRADPADGAGPTSEPDGPGDLPRVDLDEPAYLLYTSGSTGTPKGVPISQRGLADYLRFAIDTYADPTEDPPVVALHSALVFDLTVTSLFLSFLTGGRVVVFDEEPIGALGRIALDDRITFLKATPSQLELFTRLTRSIRPLRTVVVGGEAFRRPLAERLADSCAPGLRIFNEYGPTEAVVGCMIHRWDRDVDPSADVPIGHAAPGSRVTVLDRFGHLTPTGAWGELYVRRPGMAQGYLHRPDESARRFLELDDRVVLGPAHDELRPADPAPTWYRTGDRVRVVRPGVAVYGGRMDDQLKVNGVRLEPAEVEAAMVTHPAVSSALVRLWHPSDATAGAGAVPRCRRCGLGVDVPGTELDDEGICNVCHSFDVVAPQTERWFRTEADLEERRRSALQRRRGDIDCLHLLSGGKDSTYALYQLVERGWNVHALTLDNGFISEGAKDNVRRSVADLGITHEFATAEAMNDIFRDSLDRYSNVCQGCYKTIYTIAVARAQEMGIPVIVTGLSRGQFFETRLVPHQFEQGRFDPDEIDRTVLEARRIYHHTPDAVTELLPEQRVFDDDAIFDEIEFVDFYRYVDVELADLYEFLEERAPWVRPADTGRSTNCLINVAGIQVHQSERGYHNYAEPYSWDVRLGHKTRDEALEELDDEVDELEVTGLLAEVGYEPKTNGVLTAWYQTVDGTDLHTDELRTHLRALLPEHAVPAAFVRIDEVPLASSAKADVSKLPPPRRFHRHGAERVEPSTPIETRIAEIWAELLGLEVVGVTDDFFDLGGASLDALNVVATIDAAFGTDLHDAAVFRSRTIRELAAVVDRTLSEGLGADRHVSIPPLDPSAPLPLSAGEEAMLFEYRAAPHDPRYNVTRIYTVTGPFDGERFRDAVEDLVRLHAPLRTSYGADRRTLDVDEALSYTELPDSSREEFDHFATTQRAVPFDLDHGPLVRIHVARTGPDRVEVLVALHHISIDAGTFDVLWQQIAACYEGHPLPILAAGYAEHAEWQRARREADDQDQRYWLERSWGRRPAVRLGLPTPHPAEPDGYLSRLTTAHPSVLTTPGHTPFAASMAAAAVALSHFTASEYVELGITASTKDHADAAPLVGYYLNSLPMELTVPAGARFADLLQQASDSISEALPHRTYPFASMVRDARAADLTPPDLSFMLAYEELAPPTFPDAQAEQRILASGASVTDLTFFVQEREQSLQLGLEYRGSALRETDAERLLALFEAVLLAGAADPDRSVQRLLDDDRGPDLTGPPLELDGRTILERFLAWVDATPDAPAVVDGHGSTRSYRDLAIAVDRLAERIERTGGDVAPRRVGVALERSTDLVAGLLAAMATGAAYVPLDPSSPTERLEEITSAADLDVVLADPADRASASRFGLPPDRVTTTADLESAADDDLLTVRRRVERVDLDRVAYVVFTSGSTGRPRGVEVTHRNLVASTAARTPWYGSDPARFLVTSSIGFDSAMVGLFWPLATGGTVVLPTDDDVRDVDRIGALIADREVTHTLMVPSLYRAVLDRAAAQLLDLEMAIVAGEACPRSLVTLHEERLPDTALINEYGPTEATVWATAHRLSADDDTVPIGRPIPGTTTRVVDARLAPVPQGVAGELLIAGPGVARGYLDDAEANAGRFLEIDGRRWYRTGDLVRVDGDLIDFVGRVDDQLNVGGNRLEPGEVEMELRRWPEVHEAVVVASAEPPMLVAHIEADALDEQGLRASLAQRLPNRSIPRRFVRHEHLPRTSHGKVDRAAAAELPIGPDPSAPSPDAVGADRGFVAVVLSSWRSVLDRDDIDRHADFFDLGGDSLAAVEIVSMVGDALGRRVPIAALLSGRTPGGMAALLDDTAPSEPTTSTNPPEAFQLITLRAGGPDGPIVVMTPAWDDVFGYRELARALPDDHTVVALVYVEQRGYPVVTSVNELVAAFLPHARSAIGEHRAAVVLGWSIGGVVAVELAQQLAASGSRVDLLALIDTFFPGEERHIWSNRWSKYKPLLRPGSFDVATRELRTMAGRRVKRLAARLGRALLAWSGATLPDEPERTSVGSVPVGALAHAPDRVGVPMVFYRATTTNPARTVARWRTVAPDLIDVEVAGRHRGFDSIMGPRRVDAITNDLMRRLNTKG